MPDTSKPVYLKLRDLIAAAIIDGTYPDGAMLPSVRAFAADRGANPLTVAKAYQQFQLDGLVEVQRGVGMFVARGASDRLRRSERELFLVGEWPAIRQRMERLGQPSQDIAREESVQRQRVATRLHGVRPSRTSTGGETSQIQPP